MKDIKPALAAEALGSFFLFATVVGSGIMARQLSGGNDALALLGNTMATGAILFVLITMLGPVSGAHFNPAVSLVFCLRGEIGSGRACGYLAMHLGGGILGVWAAHTMFGLPVLQWSHHLRGGEGQWLGEFIATFGLIFTILATRASHPHLIPASVALLVTAGYWFTSSTSFANPAITVARSLSDSFAGIAPVSVLGFIAAQMTGAICAHWCVKHVIET